MTADGCIGCDDSSWFESYDRKEFEPQPDGTYKLTMFVDGKQASVIIQGMHESNKYDEQLCAKLGIPFDPDNY